MFHTKHLGLFTYLLGFLILEYKFNNIYIAIEMKHKNEPIQSKIRQSVIINFSKMIQIWTQRAYHHVVLLQHLKLLFCNDFIRAIQVVVYCNCKKT